MQTNNGLCKPCDLVFVATEHDMLYAFKASSNSQTPIWSLDLAHAIDPSGTALDCSQFPMHPMCQKPPGSDFLVGPFVGVTGTPVIDVSGGANNNTLYVAEIVVINTSQIGYYLVAVDITSGQVRGNGTAWIKISGTVPGGSPSECHTAAGNPVNFDDNHVQRAGLLLLNNVVYVAFAPNPEHAYNGWMFGYALISGSSFSQTAIFNSTPHGTGGGIWQSGAAPASDGSSIYVATANGTLDLIQADPLANDAGDSLLRLNPSNLAILDYYTPFDVFNYPPPGGNGLCLPDEDFGSGGVLVVPAPFTYNNQSVLINADKQSNVYVTNRAALGGYVAGSSCAGSTNIIQCITTPNDGHGNKQDPDQGYWASPAYWHYNDGQDHYLLYYSPTTEKKADNALAPYPMYAFSLTNAPSGPIPDPPTASTLISFCKRSPTPSGSWNGSDPTTGIVWAIEHQNQDNPIPNDCNGSEWPGAALHAFKATDLTQDLYNSRHNNPQGSVGGEITSFSTPTVFKGQVYVGTQTEVDVYGLCPQNGCP